MRAFQEGISCLLSPGAPDSPVQITFLLWQSRPLAPESRWRTRHCPVHTGQSGAPIRPLARPCVTRGLRGRPLARPTLAHRTVRCLTGQSGELKPYAVDLVPESGDFAAADSPDSPVIYSHTPPSRPESRQFTRRQPGAPDTVRCTTGHCPVHPDCAESWLL